MFGLLRRKAPLGAWEKAWVETRMHWIAQQFGIERLLEAEVVLPTDGFFPGAYQGTRDDVERYLELVFRYLGTHRSDVRIEICADAVGAKRPLNSEVERENPLIRIPQSRLTDPQLLVATLAHELAYDTLRRNRLLPQIDDGPWVADLLVVFLGLGVFCTNATVIETQISLADRCADRMQEFGYLPTRMLAYGLTLFAWLREESRPHWAKSLRQDAESIFRSGLRYVEKTSDSMIRISNLHLQRSALSVNDLITELEQGSASCRIAALWSLAERGLDGLAATTAVTHCLRAKDPSVRAEAAATLAALGPGIGPTALEQLIECLQDRETQVRAAAAQALGSAGTDMQVVVPELASALGDDSPQVVGAAATAIRPHGSAASSALGAVLQALRMSLVHCHNENAVRLTATLLSIVPDAEHQVREFFDECDAELRLIALELLTEQSIEGTA